MHTGLFRQTAAFLAVLVLYGLWASYTFLVEWKTTGKIGTENCTLVVFFYLVLSLDVFKANLPVLHFLLLLFLLSLSRKTCNALAPV